jgi:2-(1,2-epoxy-1,2-dihydrophenyl)acetyl-CoA isomerase
MHKPRFGNIVAGDAVMETLTLNIQDSVAVLAFNRPNALNALTQQLLDEFNDVLDQILKAESGVRCLLLTGTGRGFSSGADLAADLLGDIGANPAQHDAGHILETHFNPLIERLIDLPIPFVTAVNGAAAGAGCSFAIAGDIVIAARSAYFLQAFVNIGLVPDVGSSWLLPRLIGKARAQAMMMLGERVQAEKALAWGMIYEVVDDDALMPRAMEIATKLSRGPTKALGMIRRSMRFSLEHGLSDVLHREREDQSAAGRTEDCMEGVNAFIEKRPAEFRGK